MSALARAHPEIAAPDFSAEDYLAFLRAKVVIAAEGGFAVNDNDINPLLKGFQRAVVRWACAGGRRAIFATFGLGKSFMQLEIVRLARAVAGGIGLIVAPLGVRQEFVRDARTLATGDHPDITEAQRAELRAWLAGRPDRVVTPQFIRRIEETADAAGLYLTNYETIRDGKLDPKLFAVTSLDEASCLRGFGGSKTFREFMRLFEGVRFKFVATATPSPNDLIELLAYSAFLEVMDVGQAKTRFFRRNSEKADQLVLHPHKEKEFWLWCASWGMFLQRPSDLGFSDEGYDLPPLQVHHHQIGVDHRLAGTEKSGQQRMFREATAGIIEAAREKRDTLTDRVARMRTILEDDPDAHYLIWHDLEAERLAIEAALPTASTVYGTQDLELREQAIIAFSEGWTQYLAAKPVLAGSGCNFQRHCHKAVFVGIGFKFNDFIQAIHRIQRFLQPHPVEIHLIYAESERAVLEVLMRKWEQHKEMAAKMSAIIKEYGLAAEAMTSALTRAMGVERVEASGLGWSMVHNDCVVEAARMQADSVDLIVTSIPFSTQYEYSPNYADFGHTDDNAHFFQQMDFLLPQLLRVLKPGRNACIHVKDRITPGGLTGLGFQTVYPFADDVRAAMRKAGFAYLGEKTNLTDVVRENNQTYRLGHTEQLKDGTRMGAGLPEKVLIFRKPPTDSSDGYADEPVAKPRPEYVDQAGRRVAYDRKREQAGEITPVAATGYSRARWQIDAHHLMRTSGDRLIAPDEWGGLESGVVYRLWKAFNLSHVYDFEYHVAIGEHLQVAGRLPPDFMLLPPHSWHPDVWTDVAQMRSLNTIQAVQGAEKHLCPLPFDIVNRAIVQFSQPGELVFDPFGGLGTIPYCAMKLGRQGAAVELNPVYWTDACRHLEALSNELAMPTLFDALELRPPPGGEDIDILPSEPGRYDVAQLPPLDAGAAA